MIPLQTMRIPARSWIGKPARPLGLTGMLWASAFVGLLGAGLAACEPTDPAHAAAGVFVDRYYVELDLAAARPHATGLALAKLTREAELLAGIDAPASAGKPTVNYQMIEESETSAPGQRSFLFELTISFTDAQVNQLALVTLQSDDSGVWQVANFEELR